MKPAIQLKRIYAHCDTCHHEFEISSVIEWLNKPCPSCSAPNIITQDDLDQFNLGLGIVQRLNSLLPQVEDGAICERIEIRKVGDKYEIL